MVSPLCEKGGGGCQVFLKVVSGVNLSLPVVGSSMVWSIGEEGGSLE